MKNKFLWAILAVILVLTLATNTLSGSFSLLDYLQYTPSERNQGYCGNCWAWAGTGVMGIALDAQQEIRKRLSVQYINSCEYEVIGKTCCTGGWLSDLANFYAITKKAIPWSNANAHWQDGDASCDTSCSSISTNPNYPIKSITKQTIATHGVGQEQAIANIKNILHQNKAVWFAFFLATGADWNNFRNFWNNQGEDVIWNPDFSCGHIWEDPGGGGHAVLCVGYNDDDPSNSYWIMLNSWGTGWTGNRPNGLFRLDMDMNYNCYFYDPPYSYYSFYWETLDVDFETVGLDCKNAIALSTGVSYNGTTVGGPSNVDSYNCSSWNESCPERVHRITAFMSGGNITATLSNLSVNLDVFILNACDPNSCVAYGDTTATYPNAPAGTYFIVVDGHNGAEGSYTLTATALLAPGKGLPWLMLLLGD